MPSRSRCAISKSTSCLLTGPRSSRTFSATGRPTETMFTWISSATASSARAQRAAAIAVGGASPSSAGREKSVFHFDVQGSVAKSTHAGLPWLRLIRQRLGQRVRFWPFDGWDISPGQSVVAEFYPSLWSRSFEREDRTQDQHDAYSIATSLAQADHDGRLAAFFKPALTASEQTLARVEGWILGVSGAGAGRREARR